MVCCSPFFWIGTFSTVCVHVHTFTVGALAVRLTASKKLRIAACIVIDVVEGTAMAALPHMGSTFFLPAFLVLVVA